MTTQRMTSIALLVTLALATFMIAEAAKKPQPEAGWQALKDGDYNKAIQEAETVLSKKADDVDANALFAEAALANGDTAVSLDHWKKVLSEEPAEPHAVRTVVELLLAQSDTTQASRIFDNAISNAKKKDLPAYLYAEGLILNARGMDKEAMVKLSQAIAKNPKEPLFFRALGQVYQKKKILALTKENYLAAIALDSTDASMHFDLGMVFMESKEYTEALAEFKKTRDINPNYPNVNYQIGKLYFYAEKYDQAVQELELAISRTQKEHFLLLSIYGQALRAVKQYEKAQEYLEKAYKLRPTEISTAHALAANSFDLKKYPRAIEVLREIVNLPDVESGDYSKLGEAFYYSAGKDAGLRPNYDSAAVYLKKAYELTPQSSRLAYLIGQNYFSADQYDSAIVYLNYKIAADTTYLPAYINLGYSYLKTEQYQNAIKSLRKAQTIDSTRVSILMMLANTLTFVDSSEAAKQVFRSIISMDSTQGDAYGGLGFLYLREEAWGRAANYLQRATALNGQSPAYWVAYGQACYYNEDYDSAERAFRNALKNDPKNQDAKNGLDTTLKVKAKKKQ